MFEFEYRVGVCTTYMGTENDSSGVYCWPAVSVEGSVEGEGSLAVTGNVQA